MPTGFLPGSRGLRRRPLARIAIRVAPHTFANAFFSTLDGWSQSLASIFVIPLPEFMLTKVALLKRLQIRCNCGLGGRKSLVSPNRQPKSCWPMEYKSLAADRALPTLGPKEEVQLALRSCSIYSQEYAA